MSAPQRSWAARATGVSRSGCSLAVRGAVNALAPGTTDTDMVRANTAERVDMMSQIMYLKRMADPDEIVAPALLLTSDAGSFITGQVLVVDGGMVVAR